MIAIARVALGAGGLTHEDRAAGKVGECEMVTLTGDVPGTGDATRDWAAAKAGYRPKRVDRILI